MNEAKMIDDRVKSFRESAMPFLSGMLDDDKIYFIDASNLLEITNEDVMEFLARDPVNGYWEPETYAVEVFDNFVNDQRYYCDKLIRGKNNAQSST